MRIELITIGAELLTGQTLNTHQFWIGGELARRGYPVSRQETIPDTPEAIVRSVREALDRSEVVITTGGLGPTSDDRTREALAEALGFPLEHDDRIAKRIEEMFARRRRPMPPSVLVQALIPKGGRVFDNDFGTAPGLGLPVNDGAKWVLMAPGPPRELRPIFIDRLIPFLQETFPLRAPYIEQILRTTGLGESRVQDMVEPKMQDLIDRGLEIGYCARPGEVDLRLSAQTSDATTLTKTARDRAFALLTDWTFAESETNLETVVIELALKHGWTLATAESCTGGHIANRLTNVAGASGAFLAGLVTYANEAKEGLLGVQKSTLETHGAVSEPVAREMVAGARRATGADLAVAVTGIAGPSGGTEDKPVGTVYIAVESPSGVTVQKHINASDRETFKYLTAQQSLEGMRRALIKGPQPA